MVKMLENVNHRYRCVKILNNQQSYEKKKELNAVSGFKTVRLSY